MSVKKLLTLLGIVSFVIFVILALLITLFGWVAAYSILGIGFIIYIIFNYFVGRYQSKHLRENIKLLSPTPYIPQSLSEFDTKLSELGFCSFGVVRTQSFPFIKRNRYVYISEDNTLLAIADPDDRGTIKFCSYFSDGYVSTNFPAGIPGETKRSIVHVVSTSLEAAFDYHAHYIDQHEEVHGMPQKFHNLQQILDWELEQNLIDEVNQRRSGFDRRLLIRLVVSIIASPIVALLFVVPIIIFYLAQDLEPPLFVIQIGLLLVPIVLIFTSIWAFKPVYKPETVEDRKKKEFA